MVDIISDELREEYQEDICEHCENCILYCKAMSYTYQCEGRYCEDALESWLDTDELGIRIYRSVKLERILKK